MISIIIPVFNSIDTLNACVDSVLCQTFSDWELILVDDGASDGSGARCEAIKDTSPQRIRVIHQPNQGVSAARNAGMKSARGNLLFFLDSDDTLAPDALAVLFQAQQEYAADIVYGGIGYRENNRPGLGPPTTRSGRVPRVHLYTTRKALQRDYNHLYVTFAIHHAAGTLYRTSLAAGLSFDERMTLGEDLQFNLQYLRRARRIAICQDVVYYYRKTTGTQATLRYDPEKVTKARQVRAMAVNEGRALFGPAYEGRAENAMYVGDVLRAIQRQAEHDVTAAHCVQNVHATSRTTTDRSSENGTFAVNQSENHRAQSHGAQTAGAGQASRATHRQSAERSAALIRSWVSDPDFQYALHHMYIDSPLWAAVYLVFASHQEQNVYRIFRKRAGSRREERRCEG